MHTRQHSLISKFKKNIFFRTIGQHNVCCPHVCVFSVDAPVLCHNPKTCRRVVDLKCPVLCEWECEAVKTGCLPMYQSCDRLETCLGCSTLVNRQIILALIKTLNLCLNGFI